MKTREYITPVGDEGLYVLDTASWRVHRPVMDKSLCKNCGMCMAFCPVNSILRNDAGGYDIGYGFCKGCGLCARECMHKAIQMVPEQEDVQ